MSWRSGDWDKEKSFAKELAAFVDISSSGNHVSVLTFNHEASLKIKFPEYNTEEAFYGAVDRFPSPTGGTNIYKALRTGLDEMFTLENGMRSDSGKMMVLITDGVQRDDSKFEEIATEYQDRDIKLVIVGVGYVDEESLRKLVASSEDLYISSNFDKLLEEVTTNLESVICTGKLSEIIYSVQFSIRFNYTAAMQILIVLYRKLNFFSNSL